MCRVVWMLGLRVNGRGLLGLNRYPDDHDVAAFELTYHVSNAWCAASSTSVSKYPNITYLNPDNDPLLADALTYVKATFGSFQALPSDYSYRNSKMVLSIKSVGTYLPGLQWYAITVLPTSSFLPNFTPKIVGSVIAIVLLAAMCVYSTLSLHNGYRKAELSASLKQDKSYNAVEAESRQNKLTAVIFFVGGIALTTVLLGIWVAGQQAVVQDGVDGITASVSTRVMQYVRHVVSAPTQLTLQNDLFVGTPAVPLSAAGYTQDGVTRSSLQRYLIAQASAAAQWSAIGEADSMVGMADGMTMIAHAVTDTTGNQQITLSMVDASTGGQLWAYNVPVTTMTPDPASGVVASMAYSGTGTAWFQQVRSLRCFPF